MEGGYIIDLRGLINPNIEDLWGKIDETPEIHLDNIWAGIELSSKEKIILQRFVKGYVNTDLKKAVKKKVEISFLCESYYLFAPLHFGLDDKADSLVMDLLK